MSRDIRATGSGEARNGREALAEFRRLQPNVVILDLCLPDVKGQEVIRSVRKIKSTAGILIMSHLAEAAEIRACLTAGAMGYLVKDSPGEELFKAVRLIAKRKPYLSQCAAALLEESAAHGVFIPRHLASFLDEILGEEGSPPERQVLALLTGGRTQAEISRSLGMPATEVGRCIQALIERLGVVSKLSRA